MSAAILKSVQKQGRAIARAAGLCRFVGLLAVFALCLQVVAPGVAKAANLEWIEICSELDIEMVQVDLSDGDGAPNVPCPDCDACTICALAAAGLPQENAVVPVLVAVPLQTVMQPMHARAWERRYFWPVTRGPPMANSEKMGRAFRAFLVSNSYKGEAL